MELNEIIDDFNTLVDEYNEDDDLYYGEGEALIDALHDYADRFTDLYRLIQPICANVYGQRTAHDDKAASAIKARIAKRLFDGGKISWSKAMDSAAADDEYTEFLNDRIFWYESWESVSHQRETIKQYIINIGQKLATHKIH